MRRIVIGGICAAVLCALIGSPAANAAEPAFFECAALKGGKFKGSACAEESAKGNHELVEGAGKKHAKFLSTNLSPKVPAIGGGEVACQKFKASGELATATSIRHLVVTQIGCDGGPSKRCSNVSPVKTHTIVTNPLEGTVGYIDAEEHRIGIDLRGEGGADIEDFNCEGFEQKVGGSVIGELASGPEPGQFTITMTRDAEGFQTYKSLEGGLEDVPIATINGSGPYASSLIGAITMTDQKVVLKG